MAKKATEIEEPFMEVVDLFCGAGGTSLGFEQAKVDGKAIAKVVACINHDQTAIRSHSANFPQCKHYTEDVRNFDVRHLPVKQPNKKSLLALWASLECTHFSNAKTGPKNADSRTLAYALIPYIQHMNADMIFIENVREFTSWGELDQDGIPVCRKKGYEYIRWRTMIESMGYLYSSRLLNSADYGSHQKRIRYFAVFVRPHIPVVFPEATHNKNGTYGLKKWRAVREVLELQDYGRSIFNRKKSLSENTLKRILEGLVKFVAKGDGSNFLMKYYSGAGHVVSLDNPGPTITTIDHSALVTAMPNAGFVTGYYGGYGSPEKAVHSLDEPCNTLTTHDRFALIHFANNQYGTGKPSSIDAPANTITSVPKCNLVTAAFLCNPQYHSKGGSLEEPCFTLIAKMDKRPPSIVGVAGGTGQVTDTINMNVFSDNSLSAMERIEAFMQAFGLSDVFMRMLHISELKRIQGFGDNYTLLGTQAEQKKAIGNAVVPHVVDAWVCAYYNRIKNPNKVQQLQMFA